MSDFEGLTRIDNVGLIVGSWSLVLSYGILSLQLVSYYRSKAKDPAYLKLGVAFLFCVDTVWQILYLVTVFRQLIEVVPGSVESFIPSTTFMCIPFFTPVIVYGVNVFLIWRYQRLSRRLWLCYALYVVATVTLASHLWSTSINMKLMKLDPTKIEEFIRYFKLGAKLGKAGLALEVFMVCTIWALLLLELLAFLGQEMMGTRRTIIRLIFVTLESGTVVTATTVGSLIFYLKKPASSNLIVLAVHMARLYFMTMMFNLNTRGSSHRLMEESSTSRPSAGIVHSESVPLSHIASSGSGHYPHNLIRVQQDTACKIDRDEEECDDFNIERGMQLKSGVLSMDEKPPIIRDAV